jgi:predicted HAD superfamily Cof-like phosphohydrolase
MLTKEDIEAFEYYNQQDRKESYPYQTPLGMVKEYQDLSGQKADSALYSALIDEEFSEWVNETRMGMSYSGELKELADLVYVIFGYANAKGWDLDEAVRRVHENNVGRMYQPDGTIKRREDGKIVKNPNAPKVNLEDLV